MGIQESSIINGLLKVVEQLQLDDLTILANADQDIDPIQFQNTLYNQGRLKKLKLQLNTKNKQVLTEALIDILPKFQHLETFVFENNNLNFTEKNNKIFHKFFESFLLLRKLKNLELRLFNMSYEINLLRQDMLYAAKILGSLEHIESIIFDAGYGINQKIVNSALLSINHQQFIQNMDQNLGCKRLKHLELKGFSPLLDYYSKLFVEKKKKEKFLIHSGFKLYSKKIFRKEILHEALHTLITDFVTLKTEK
ncbi:hypothetical protein PPERSA_05203 [Pseudocohnilembus persalinus]|uniref:Uncharacterized protein n=1 Tax=Pseudocohnilembus persalinus TaxID=266149 RepID=A0A0V0R9C1_PSEPJ|nr:hypothetical protein PPERSA_05203 [Pseudocohnilembus persalinus]|eukprot:KRX11094.1 hypothetical protein PPERSA_05203 [Pseudocohnilembus persalinus]